MMIRGTKSIAAEWLSSGNLAIAQGNKVLEISPDQAVKLIRFIEQRKDPAIIDYVGEKIAMTLSDAESNKRGA